MILKYGPCKDCKERFQACSDNCPKDARGEYGYKAHNAELQKVKAAERKYKLQRREDYMRSEQRKEAQVQFAKSRK